MKNAVCHMPAYCFLSLLHLRFQKAIKKRTPLPFKRNVRLHDPLDQSIKDAYPVLLYSSQTASAICKLFYPLFCLMSTACKLSSSEHLTCSTSGNSGITILPGYESTDHCFVTHPILYKRLPPCGAPPFWKYKCLPLQKTLCAQWSFSDSF